MQLINKFKKNQIKQFTFGNISSGVDQINKRVKK